MEKGVPVSMFFRWIKRRRFLSEVVMLRFNVSNFKVLATSKPVTWKLEEVYSVRKIFSKSWIGYQEILDSLKDCEDYNILHHVIKISGYEVSIFSDVEMSKCFGVLQPIDSQHLNK